MEWRREAQESKAWKSVGHNPKVVGSSPAQPTRNDENMSEWRNGRR